MRAADGKMRLTDVADTEQLFRLIQSIPSPKAELFKIWLAKKEWILDRRASLAVTESSQPAVTLALFLHIIKSRQ